MKKNKLLTPRLSQNPASWRLFANWLAGDSQPQADALASILERALDIGAQPFEVIVGSPASRYGARITFERSIPGANMDSLCAHPPSPPQMEMPAELFQEKETPADWIGARVSLDGTIDWKRYHHVQVIPGEYSIPANSLTDWSPVMVAEKREIHEVYLRYLGELTWNNFVQACTSPLRAPSFSFSPHPRTVSGAFCASFQWNGTILKAASVFADQRALPNDEEISTLWSEAMTDADRDAYRRALDAVHSTGRRGRDSWHSMLAWTFDAERGWHRAASLRLGRI